MISRIQARQLESVSVATSRPTVLRTLFHVVGAFAEPDRSPPQAGLAVGEFIWTGGDCHIYDNHVGQVTEQLRREARPYPELVLAHRDSIFDYVYGDIVVKDYHPHPAIKAPVAV